jgi:ERCC4-type nuclease
MIIVDNSETREGSRLPNIEGAVVSEILETVTGADIMISAMEIPPSTPVLIQKHIDNGALLVQRKSGEDLASSLGARLNESLAKMRETGARQAQCVLLFTGILEWHKGNLATINGVKSRSSYFAILGGLSKWHDRGGVVEFLANDDLIPKWVDLKHKHVKEYQEVKEKKFHPKKIDVVEVDPGDPLQELIKVEDWRAVVANMPGVGPKRATALRDTMLEEGAADNFITALVWLTEFELTEKVPGIGRKTCENIREFCGLENIYHLYVSLKNFHDPKE